MTTALKWSAKDPQDIRDYWFDFGPLLPDGAVLTAATVTIAPGQFEIASPYMDLAKQTDDIANDTWVVIRVTGGTPAKYVIHYHVTDSTGQEFDLDKTLEVKERTLS